MATAGRAVVVSGLAVAIGPRRSLLFVPVPFIRSLGVGGLLIPLVSIAAALTLQPALLVARSGAASAAARRGADGGVLGAARARRSCGGRVAVLAAATAVLLVARGRRRSSLELTPGLVLGARRRSPESARGSRSCATASAPARSRRPTSSSTPARRAARAPRRCAQRSTGSPTGSSATPRCSIVASGRRAAVRRRDAAATRVSSWPGGTSTARAETQRLRPAAARRARPARRASRAERASSPAARRRRASTSSTAPTAPSRGSSLARARRHLRRAAARVPLARCCR